MLRRGTDGRLESLGILGMRSLRDGAERRVLPFSVLKGHHLVLSTLTSTGDREAGQVDHYIDLETVGSGVRNDAEGWKYWVMQLVQLIGSGPKGGRRRTGIISGKSYHAFRIHSSPHGIGVGGAI